MAQLRGLARKGRPVDEVISDLAAKRQDDVDWSSGRTFGMVYDGGADVRDVAERAARLYLHENALNTQAFPSLRAIQSEVVAWTAQLLNGDKDVAGFWATAASIWWPWPLIPSRAWRSTCLL